MPQLTPEQAGSVEIVQLAAPTPEALTLLEEYYAALDVLLRDTPEKLTRTLAEPASAMWLAYAGGSLAGCVLLRGLPSVPRAGECKRLYVRPSARGLGLGDRLLAAMEQFAFHHGLAWIYLDSDHTLTHALALYHRRGYHPCPPYNANPQADIFLRKRLA